MFKYPLEPSLVSETSIMDSPKSLKTELIDANCSFKIPTSFIAIKVKNAYNVYVDRSDRQKEV